MEYLFCSAILTVFGTTSAVIEVQYLRGVPRLNDSNYYDCYFTCNAQGNMMQWEVNGVISDPFTGDSVSVVKTQAASNFSYIAMLLSSNQSSVGHVFDSVLIVSSQGMYNFEAVCRNESSSAMVTNTNSIQDVENESKIDSVFLQYLVTFKITMNDDSKRTSIFICGTNSSFVTWRINRSDFMSISFTQGDSLNEERAFLQNGGSVVKNRGILIGIVPYMLVTVMFVVDSSELTVTCGYSQNIVNLTTEQDSTTSESTIPSTMSESTPPTTSMETMLLEKNTIASDTTSTAFTKSVETTNDNNDAWNIIIIGSVALVIGSLLVIIIIVMSVKIIRTQKRVPIMETRRETILEGVPVKETRRGTILEGELIREVCELLQIPQEEAISAEDSRRIQEFSNPIKLEKVSKLLRDNPSGQLIYEEHEFLWSITIKETKNETCNEGIKHMQKNKYENFLPYDSSRVHLNPIDGVEGSDYINASFIDGYRRSQAYIAAQAPLSNTIFDFWRMINEYRVTTIVMFHDDECEQYWPESIEGVLTDDKTCLQVTYINCEEFAYYGVRTFKLLKQSSHENPLYIKQYHIFNWSYDRKLRFHTPIIQLIQHMKSDYKKLGDNSPIVVQSIAGTGRASFFITLDAMMEQMNEEQAIGVFEFVRNMRHKRKFMLRNKDHYLHIYKILDELYTCGDTSVQASNLREKIQELNILNENTGLPGFSVQFDLLNEVSRQPKRGEQSVAIHRHNRNKNISLRRVPYDENRVTLIPSRADSNNSDYINASYVGGYQHEDKYIATQVPLEDTAHDFWRMIWEYPQYQTIVFIGPLIEKHMVFHSFWPQKDESHTYHQLTITTMSEEHVEDYIERRIHIENAGESRDVVLYHYKDWLEDKKPQNSTGILHLIDRLESHKQNAGSNGMVVMCSDGTTRTGAFITIHAMIRKAKTENVVDFFQFIMLLRIERAELVWELEHYIFCHEVLADYMERLLQLQT